MIKISQYLWLNAFFATLLVGFLAVELEPSFELCFYVFVHAMLAALLNGFLLRTIQRRNMALLGSPLVSVLAIAQLYFTVNAVKYYVPNRVYGDVFEITELQRFVGSLGAAAVLFLGVLLLSLMSQQRAEELRAWLNRDRAVERMFWFAVLANALGKLVLLWLGYGSVYSDTAFSAANVRAYWDLLLLSGTGFFELIAFVLAVHLITGVMVGHERRPWLLAGGIATIGVSLAWAVHVQARMPFLFLVVLAIFAMQIRAPRRALLALQVFLLALPLSALTMANLFTVVLGRSNITGFTLQDTVGELGYRADLTDLAVAIYRKTAGEGAGSGVLVDAVSNAVPRVFWPSKDEYYRNTYYTYLADHGLPRMDYLESPFSNGMAVAGAAGFVLWPVLYMLLVGWIAAGIAALPTRVSSRMWVLLALGLMTLRVENEWEGVALLFRDALLFGGLLPIIASALRRIPRITFRRSTAPVQQFPAGLHE